MPSPYFGKLIFLFHFVITQLFVDVTLPEPLKTFPASIIACPLASPESYFSRSMDIEISWELFIFKHTLQRAACWFDIVSVTEDVHPTRFFKKYYKGKNYYTISLLKILIIMLSECFFQLCNCKIMYKLIK